MALCMVTFHGFQAAQTNEELPSESSLNLTLTQHLRDEEPEFQEVHARLEVEPFEPSIIIFHRTLAP